MSKKETFEKFLKFMEKWHYEDFNAFETHFNKLLSMKGREQLTNENEALKDSIAVILAQKKNVNEQIDQLKQQLAEKDKEIERLNTIIGLSQLQVSEKDRLNTSVNINSLQYNQTQLAIQELEKTLNFIENVFDKALKNCSLNNGYYDQILDFIDQQINELKRVKRRIK